LECPGSGGMMSVSTSPSTMGMALAKEGVYHRPRSTLHVLIVRATPLNILKQALCRLYKKFRVG